MAHIKEGCVFKASAMPDINSELFTGLDQVKKVFHNWESKGYRMGGGTKKPFLHPNKVLLSTAPF